jgi:hypothetical protein
MKYTHHDDDNEKNLLENLEALCRKRTAFPGDIASVLSGHDDSWMLMDRNARIDLEVDCWGRRLA